MEDRDDPVMTDALMRVLGHPDNEGALETEIGLICAKCSYARSTLVRLEWSQAQGRRICPNGCGTNDDNIITPTEEDS